MTMTVAEYLAREYHACCAEISVPIAVWVGWRAGLYSGRCDRSFTVSL